MLFVFPPLVFSAKLLELDSLLKVLVCCALLILASSSVYIINDLADVEADRRHPKKRQRPIAAGQVSVRSAKIAALVLPLCALLATYYFDARLLPLLLAYLLLQTAYSYYLKHLALLDIFVVTAGFVLRLMAGGLVIDVTVSPWLYTSAGLLALFLAIGKRRQELIELGENAALSRPVFRDYNLPLLDDMLRATLTSTMITYILYTVESGKMLRQGENWGLLTVPIVVYGLFRYLYLIRVQERGSAPDEILLTDRPLQITIAVAALTYLAILYLP